MAIERVGHSRAVDCFGCKQPRNDTNWRCDFNRTHKMMKSATKVAPPIVILNSRPRVKNLILLRCFGYRLNMTIWRCN
ncbi:MAG: hypothetical protein K2N54_06045 [Helicobacter sp.]|nr:hypothetical protein [Helicobacter sp.]